MNGDSTPGRVALSLALLSTLVSAGRAQVPVARIGLQNPPEVSFAAEIQPIFDVNCSCHTEGARPLGLDLSPGRAIANLVKVRSGEARGLRLVEPGSPEKSYLWHKLNGTQREVDGSGVARHAEERGEATSPRRDDTSVAYDLAESALHNAYHCGQIVLLRRIQGLWPPAGGDTNDF